jgi:hypothetical protein
VSKCRFRGEKVNKTAGFRRGNLNDLNDLKGSSKGTPDDDSPIIRETLAGCPRGRPSGSPSLSRKAHGADELNLAEFPLAVLSRRRSSGHKTLAFEDEVFDDGAKRTVNRRLVISGSDRFGLPTPVDVDVLLVLIQLSKQRGNFKARVLSFSQYELVELLRWNHGGGSYRRLDASLQRWASTTLYYHGAWWDRAVRCWQSKTFHVIDTLDLRGRGRKSTDKLRCSLAWNEVLFQSFQAGSLKVLDLDTYFSLKRPAARQAYRFLDKRFYHRARLEFDLRVFACEHVGLSRQHDMAQLRRALDSVLRELEEIRFLQPAARSKRYFRHGQGNDKVVLVRETQPKAFERTLVRELTKRGVWTDVAPDLASALPEPEILRYLALHDWLLTRNDRRIAKNPAGFLAACIANRFPLPRDFELAHGESEVSTRKAPTSKPMPFVPILGSSEPSDAETVALDRELAKLAEEERRAVEAEAVRVAKPLVAATYERLRREGGALFEQVRVALLREHFKRQRLTENADAPDATQPDAG